MHKIFKIFKNLFHKIMPEEESDDDYVDFSFDNKDMVVKYSSNEVLKGFYQICASGFLENFISEEIEKNDGNSNFVDETNREMSPHRISKFLDDKSIEDDVIMVFPASQSFIMGNDQ